MLHQKLENTWILNISRESWVLRVFCVYVWPRNLVLFIVHHTQSVHVSGWANHEAICQRGLIYFLAVFKIIMYRYLCSKQEQQGGGRAPMLRCFQVLTQQSWLTLSSDCYCLSWSGRLGWKLTEIPSEQCCCDCKSCCGARVRYECWYLKWTGIKMLTLGSFSLDL